MHIFQYVGTLNLFHSTGKCLPLEKGGKELINCKVIFNFYVVVFFPHSVQGLECYQCSNITLDSGSHQVASFYHFLTQNTDADCGTMDNPDNTNLVACPTDRNYQCGYVYAEMVAYAHKGTVFYVYILFVFL